MKQLNFLKYAAFAVLTVAALAFSSCSDDEEKSPDNSVTKYNTPKYIFFFIGDGMSSPQINLAEAAINNPNFQPTKKADFLGELNLRKFPVTGMQTTHAEDRYITGSAASATALATGYKTAIGHIAVESDGTTKLTTMAEMAQAKGMKVGIVSSVSIDHATPACFYAHNESRNNYQQIGEDLIASNFDYFAGGNVRFNKYDETQDLAGFITAAEAAGYSYVSTKAGFDALTAGSKAIATIKKLETYTGDGCALPYVMDLDEETSQDNTISLADFTEKGIEVLNNKKGFFLMVEGGKIDWACHANDAVAATHNTVEFDKAIAKAIAFYNEHPDETLIVVTGDHECGGMTLGYAATGYETAFDILSKQTVSYVSFSATVAEWRTAGTKTFAEALVDVEAKFGLGSEGLELSPYESELLEAAFNKSMGYTAFDPHNLTEEEVRIYGGYDPFTVSITHVLNNKAGVDFTSYTHTATPVPVFAMGQGQYEFNGYYDNTDVAKRIIKVAELDEK